MRILAVTNMWPTPARPAAGALVVQQVEGLRQTGHEIRVLHFDRLEEGMRAYWAAGTRCEAEARAFNADLIHVMYGGVMAALITRGRRTRPVVVSFCGSDLMGEPLSPATRRLCARLGVFASRRAARAADAVIVKSRGLADALPAGVDRSKVLVIPNGVDLHKFQPLDREACRASIGWVPGRRHVLFPATNSAAVKRPALARAALDLVARTGMAVEMHDLAGVPHDSVPLWMNAADALLLTSAHEGSPNVVKEALACDLPVVSVDVGDVAERIQGVDGCYIAGADPDALARCLTLALTHPGRIAGRSRMVELSIQRISERLIELYAEVLRRPTTYSSNQAPRAAAAREPTRIEPVSPSDSLPTVTIVMPVRNEASRISRSLGAVLAQDYPPGRTRIVVVDGESTDGTAEVVRRLAEASGRDVTVLRNTRRIVATGLNAALAAHDSDVVVRVDGHCEIPPDYVRACVRHLQDTGVDGVGGSVHTIGETVTARAIAIAMSCRFGVGGSLFRVSRGLTCLADTVPFPAYTRAAMERAGAYDEELVRNQDDEYNYRLRALGGRVLLAGDIESRYYSRGTVGQLARQYFQYGYWKVRVMQKHPLQMRPRQFAPPAFAALLIAAIAIAPVSRVGFALALLLAGTYAAALVLASAVAGRRDLPAMPLLPIVFAALHLSYGIGFLAGLVAFRRRWSAGWQPRRVT